jgi:hypothetical protein
MSVLFASALACSLVFAGSRARAEDVTWSYSWSGTAEVLNDKGGGVKFHLGSGTLTNNQNGVTAALLEAFGPSGNIVNGKYSLSVHLVDTATSKFTDLSFGGVLNGPTNLGLQNTFSAPVARVGAVGANNFGVIIGLYSAPGPTGSGVQGVLGTNVVVTPSGGGGTGGTGATGGGTKPPSQVPEPTAMSLSAIGGIGIALALFFRRRLNLRVAGAA